MFDKVIVMGVGTVASNCAKVLLDKNIEVIFIETRSDNAISAERFCRINNIQYMLLEKEEITYFLTSISAKTLIVSVSNRYLFPSMVLNKSNITVINYHGSLLPKFPGRNAEAWAIYFGEKTAGITWHYVVEEIDAGDIIIQKSIDLNSSTTSFSLLRQNSRLALDGFKLIIDDVLKERAKVISQNEKERYPIFYSWKKPNNGELDLRWKEDQIDAFLRAMDYGPLKILGLPSVVWESVKYNFSSYKIAFNNEKLTCGTELYNNSLIIITPNFKFTLDRLIKL